MLGIGNQSKIILILIWRGSKLRYPRDLWKFGNIILKPKMNAKDVNKGSLVKQIIPTSSSTSQMRAQVL